MTKHRSVAEHGFSDKILAVALLLAMVPGGKAFAWGDGWRTGSSPRAAIEILPDDMRQAVAGHEQALIAHSVDPDMWSHDPDERHRHWFDVELADPAGHRSRICLASMTKPSRSTAPTALRTIGVLPWRIAWYSDTVVAAMQEPSPETWIKLAALSHYVSDATMPLHTSVNYDGQ